MVRCVLCVLLCTCLVSVMKASELPFKRGQPAEAPCLYFDMQLFSDFPLKCPIKHFLVSPDALLVRGNVTLGVGPSLLGPLYKPQASHVWCPYMILHASCLIGTLFLQPTLMILAWLTSQACVPLSSVMFNICITSAGIVSCAACRPLWRSVLRFLLPHAGIHCLPSGKSRYLEQECQLSCCRKCLISCCRYLWMFCAMPSQRFVAELALTGLLAGPLTCWIIVIGELLAITGAAGLLLMVQLLTTSIGRRAMCDSRESASSACRGTVQIWVVGLNGRLALLRVHPLCSLELVLRTCSEHYGVPVCWLRVLHDGKLCQLSDVVCDFHPDPVFRLRAFPLQGGAPKDVESLKTFFATLLIAHGVPQDVLPKRIQTILDKVPISSLRTVASSENPWNALKGVCNDHMIRILLPEELHAHSEMRRLQKQSDSLLPKGRGKGKGSVKTGASRSSSRAPLPAVLTSNIDPRSVHVDVQHFRVPDAGALVRRDPLKFPSDGPGLYIMLLEQIMPYLPPRALHLDATVVFVLGRLAPGLGKFVEMPAADAQNKPILVPGTIVQFGAVNAEFAVSCPSVDFSPTPSTPVEVKIVRDLVSDEWCQAVVDPLSFAARAIPALKSDGAISHSWARHFYSDQRKRCRPSDASHFHGYILVLDSCLDAALKASGTKGVFLCPRSPEKTRDLRFRIIPCVEPFEQVKAKAHGCEHALGLAQTQSGYGIWVKQEHFNEVKAVLAPGALLERVVEPSRLKFLALNLPNTLPATQVTSALRQLGWNSAIAIRPLRAKTWLIGADETPPAFHFRLGDFTVMVSPFDPSSGSGDEVLVSNLCAVHDETMEPKYPVQERFDYLQASMRQEVQSFLREELNASHGKLEQRLTVCEQIGASNVEALSQVQHAVMANDSQVRELSSKVQSLEVDVKSNHSELIQQMKDLFTQHDARLENRFEHALANHTASRQFDIDARFEQAFAQHHARIAVVEDTLRERDVRHKPWTNA